MIHLKKNGKMLQIYCLLIPVFIGILTFLVIYGMTPLNVTNDHWILSGYDESDIVVHYAGWLAFRSSNWSFPLGMADQMSVGTGTIISFTDSIPIIAIFFKLIRGVLPDTFQYFGIFTLMCFILQAVAAFVIINHKTKNIAYSVLGTLLFSFAPTLLERAFRHSALGAQWLVLFSIYLYLKYCEEKRRRTYIYFLILEILAIGIHPYFLPMVACFAFLCVVKDIKEKRYWSIVCLLAIQIVAYLFGFIIGVLGSGISPSRTGFGYASMNINSIINPNSRGGNTWSVLMKTRPLILGNNDGIYYLGAGILVLGVISFLLMILMKKQKLALKMLKKHIFLIGVCVFLTGFAISNVVTFDDKILLTIPLPEFVLYLCGIFRASARMFWPVYYVWILFLILLLWRVLGGNERRKCAYGILIFVAALQIFDIHGSILEKHRAMIEKASHVSYIDDVTLNQMAKDCEGVLIEEFSGKETFLAMNVRLLAVWAFKNNMSTYYPLAISGDYSDTVNLSNEILQCVKETGDLGEKIIATSSSEIADLYDQFENLEVYEIEDKYFIFDTSKGRNDK